MRKGTEIVNSAMSRWTAIEVLRLVHQADGDTRAATSFDSLHDVYGSSLAHVLTTGDWEVALRTLTSLDRPSPTVASLALYGMVLKAQWDSALLYWATTHRRSLTPLAGVTLVTRALTKAARPTTAAVGILNACVERKQPLAWSLGLEGLVNVLQVCSVTPALWREGVVLFNAAMQCRSDVDYPQLCVEAYHNLQRAVKNSGSPAAAEGILTRAKEKYGIALGSSTSPVSTSQSQHLSGGGSAAAHTGTERIREDASQLISAWRKLMRLDERASVEAHETVLRRLFAVASEGRMDSTVAISLLRDPPTTDPVHVAQIAHVVLTAMQSHTDSRTVQMLTEAVQYVTERRIAVHHTIAARILISHSATLAAMVLNAGITLTPSQATKVILKCFEYKKETTARLVSERFLWERPHGEWAHYSGDAIRVMLMTAASWEKAWRIFRIQHETSKVLLHVENKYQRKHSLSLLFRLSPGWRVCLSLYSDMHRLGYHVEGRALGIVMSSLTESGHWDRILVLFHCRKQDVYETDVNAWRLLILAMAKLHKWKEALALFQWGSTFSSHHGDKIAARNVLDAVRGASWTASVTVLEAIDVVHLLTSQAVSQILKQHVAYGKWEVGLMTLQSVPRSILSSNHVGIVVRDLLLKNNQAQSSLINSLVFHVATVYQHYLSPEIELMLASAKGTSWEDCSRIFAKISVRDLHWTHYTEMMHILSLQKSWSDVMAYYRHSVAYLGEDEFVATALMQSLGAHQRWEAVLRVFGVLRCRGLPLTGGIYEAAAIAFAHSNKFAASHACVVSAYESGLTMPDKLFREKAFQRTLLHRGDWKTLLGLSPQVPHHTGLMNVILRHVNSWVLGVQYLQFATAHEVPVTMTQKTLIYKALMGAEKMNMIDKVIG